jgi:signal transduction protein with GAF and PtsI domain
MIPFCRTVGEAKKVLQVMADNGLERGAKGLKVYVMCEIPSNVLLAHTFAAHFDGFSIGSNDLTQLTLGVDRDSAELADLFDEQDEAVKQLTARVIVEARKNGCKVGLCGQAPSNDPKYARFLVIWYVRREYSMCLVLATTGLMLRWKDALTWRQWYQLRVRESGLLCERKEERNCRRAARNSWVGGKDNKPESYHVVYRTQNISPSLTG